jgi:hypothetical protein
LHICAPAAATQLLPIQRSAVRWVADRRKACRPKVSANASV